MKPVKLLLWLVVLMAAAGMYYWSTSQEAEEQAAQALADRAMALEDTLQARLVELAGREYPQPIRLERREKEHRWQMVKPVDYPADAMILDGVLQGMAGAKIQRRIKEPGPLADFGLEPPAITVMIETADQTRHALELGSYSTTKEFVYARSPESKEVWLLPATTRQAASRTVMQLRDKQVLDFAVPAVKQLDIIKDGKQIALKRTKEGWEFAAGGEASSENTDQVLYQLHGIRTLDFIDQGIDPAKMGLDKPHIKITLGLGEGSEIGLVVGGKVPTQDERYARLLSGGPVLVLKEESLERLPTDKRSYIDRKVVKFNRDEVLAIKIRRGKKTLAYAMEDGLWMLKQPPGDVNQGQYGGLFLYDLGDLLWEEELPKGGDYGLDHPQARVTISLAGAKQGQTTTTQDVTLVLGKVDPKSGWLAVSLAGDDRVWGVSPEFADKLPTGEEK